MAVADHRTTGEGGPCVLDDEVRGRVHTLLESLVFEPEERAAESFENLVQRAGDLWRRKQAMEGTKSETRDLLGEVLFSRLRRSFREFDPDSDPTTEIRSAEWVLRFLFAGSAMKEFATALDRAMLEAARPQDFSFAGRADFISVEEVLQLLSSRNYHGMLGIEKDDNRIDIYIKAGMVVFLDPHHLIRRVLPGANSMKYREIPADLIKRAEKMKTENGKPLLLSLVELGFLQEGELSDLFQHLGLEVFFEFLSQQGACTFFYKKLEEMPAHVEKYSFPMPVTPILLEGSKRTDDWSAMSRVFPDPRRPIKPVPDMFARISSMDLGVLEIKLLAMINGETSPKQLAPAIGLPLFEVYQYLVRFAREEVIVPAGGAKVLEEVMFTFEETMEKAFEALDANEDEYGGDFSLDDALPDPFAPRAPSAEPSQGESFLDILAQADLKRD